MRREPFDRAIDGLDHDARSARIGGRDKVEDVVELGDSLPGPPDR
jgi:hypothetical protein